MEKLLDFLAELDRRMIFRRLASVRDAIMVDVHIPSERWEVEFFRDGDVEVEIFRSDGHILSDGEADQALTRLLKEDDEVELRRQDDEDE